MTLDELKTRLATSKARKLSLTWAQFAASVSEASAAQKADILAAVNAGKRKDVATAVMSLANAKKLALARAEVDAMLVDGSMTADDLIALL